MYHARAYASTHVQWYLIMSLYRYLKKEGPVVPTTHTCGGSFLSKHNVYVHLPEERAQIEKYTVENGSTKPARYFFELLD